MDLEYKKYREMGSKLLVPLMKMNDYLINKRILDFNELQKFKNELEIIIIEWKERMV